MSRRRLCKELPIDTARAFSTTCRAFLEARPPTAPKQFPDIPHIRRNVDVHEQNAVLRNYLHHRDAPRQIAANSQRVTEIDASLKKPRVQVKALQAQLSSKKADKARILLEINKLKPVLDKLVKDQDQLEATSRTLALGLPNLTSQQTPVEGEPKLLSYINYDAENPPAYSKSADHSVIGEKLQLLDFVSASTTAGWGFYYLLNEAALLEQALIQYALTVAMRHGWRIVTPPSLVYAHMADSCGFQPRDQSDEQQIWQVAQPPKDEGKPKRSLAATAEIPLAGLFASKDIPEQNLPIKVVGTSRCYRAEAGSRGVDTKGLYRVHEFTKVEMFGWTNSPGTLDSIADMESWVGDSTKLFDEMVQIQIEVLTSLGLPCRVLEMPSSDLGASAYRKIDIEALFPSRMNRDGGWGEVTSASMCTDYQSRRLDTRVVEKGGSRKRFAQTVNGTAVAIPRVLAGLLEHGWQEEEQAILIPEVLRGFMGGMDKIRAKT